MRVRDQKGLKSAQDASEIVKPDKVKAKSPFWEYYYGKHNTLIVNTPENLAENCSLFSL